MDCGYEPKVFVRARRTKPSSSYRLSGSMYSKWLRARTRSTGTAWYCSLLFFLAFVFGNWFLNISLLFVDLVQAGYDKVKLEIEDTVVLALQNPELYEDIARKTRCRYESNRPRAVLFEGPPGTGKTLSARIIAQQAGIPMIHIPIESVVSKWYGDSEKKMSAIFDACEKLDGAIIFIDEVGFGLKFLLDFAASG